MIFRTVFSVIVVWVFVTPMQAQHFVSGRIYDKSTDHVLSYVTVRNLTRGVSRQSDYGGNYLVPAQVGDLLIFSSTAYLPDSITVNSFMLSNPFDISLEQNPEVLQSVMVGGYNNYQLDSLARREDYKKFYETPKTAFNGGKTPTGFGITFSPASYFSKKEKQKRNLGKRLAHNEEAYYIDYKFPPALVTRLTGLQKDSLHHFMLRYRPGYKFCRKSSQEDILLYINDKFKLFMKRP